MKYTVIVGENGLNNFIDTVNNYITNGWICLDGINIVNTTWGTKYFQAMLKKENDKKKRREEE